MDKIFEEIKKNMLSNLDLPPPLEILKRTYVNKEPVRSGFNTGFLLVDIKNNYENVRTA